jgi:hypothetical protein
VILLAALGALATWAGWSMADRLGIPDGRQVAEAGVLAASPAGMTHSDARPDASVPAATDAAAIVSRPLATIRPWLPAPAAILLRLLAVPFHPAATFSQLLGTFARLAWFVVVWSIFGTAIARQVALKLAGEEVPGFGGALWFGSKLWLSAFNAVAFVILGILALSIPGALLGLLMRSDIGLLVAGLLWPLVLLGAIILAILAIGVVAGWPLMVGGVAVERGDSFQAISTAFSYLYQRPLHYIFYGAVALAVALPALAAAHLFATATTTLALWAASLGMGHARTAEVLAGLHAHAGGGVATLGIRALAFSTDCLEALLGSFGWGYFWAVSTAAYLLLRRDVDSTELDEVVVEELPGEAG